MQIEEMIKRYRDGQKDIFDKIEEYINDNFYLVALSRTKDKEMAKEAIQDTLVALYFNIDKIRKIESVRAWILKVVINCCNKLLNKKNISIEELDYELASKDNGYDTVIQNLSFMDIISFLDKDDQTLFILYYRNEYTSKEIAKMLDMKEGTIRSKISRLTKKIQDRFLEGQDGK